MTSKSRTAPSPCVETSQRLSGEKTRFQTSAGYSRRQSILRVDASKRTISSDPDAAHWPSGENATARPWSRWTGKEPRDFFSMASQKAAPLPPPTTMIFVPSGDSAA